MTGAQENLRFLGFAAIAAAATWGWISDKSRKIKEDQFHRHLREALESERQEFQLSASACEQELNRRAETKAASLQVV